MSNNKNEKVYQQRPRPYRRSYKQGTQHQLRLPQVRMSHDAHKTFMALCVLHEITLPELFDAIARDVQSGVVSPFAENKDGYSPHPQKRQ